MRRKKTPQLSQGICPLKWRQSSLCWNGRHVSFLREEDLPPSSASSDPGPTGQDVPRMRRAHILLGAAHRDRPPLQRGKQCKAAPFYTQGRYKFKEGQFCNRLLRVPAVPAPSAKEKRHVPSAICPTPEEYQILGTMSQSPCLSN